MKKCFSFIVLVVMLLFTSPVAGLDIEIPSSFNPVGSGSRALGIGGAFIAVADDATSASWNPSGLIQLRTPEFSIVTSGCYRSEDNDFRTNPEASGFNSVSENDLNYLSATYPFSLLNYNMVLSISYQRLYDLNRIWDFTFRSQSPDFESEDVWNYRQDGGLSAIGLSYCLQINPSLSAGVTLNIWNDQLSGNSWKKTYINTASGYSGQTAFTNSYSRTDEYSFKGVNANIGVLWSLNQNISVGAVIKTPFQADVNHVMHKQWDVRFLNEPDYNQSGTLTGEWRETIKMPMSYGIGALFHVTDRLSLAADIYRTEWDEFVYKDEDGVETSPISGKDMGESDISPTYQARIGAEYLLMKDKTKEIVIPIRGGVFYDPAPAPGNPDDVYGFSLGAGITKIGCFSFDIAWQYRFGNNTADYMLTDLGFSQDIREHIMYASLIVYTSLFTGKRGKSNSSLVSIFSK